MPRSVDGSLGDGVEVHGVETWRVDRNDPGGNTVGSEEGCGQVSKVSTDSCPTEQGCDGTVDWSRRPGNVGDVDTDPAGNGVEKVVAGQAGEFGSGQGPELVGLAIPTRA